MSKKNRPGSHMGDDERATPQPGTWAPPASSTSGEIPEVIDFEVTPPPIVIDDIGRPVSRTAPPVLHGKPRERKTVQELADDLWPARKALQLILDTTTRLAKLEERADGLEKHGPAAVAAAHVAALRAELVGADGRGGVVGALAGTVERDLADHRKAMADVEARATKSDKFVRRFLYTVGGLVAGSIIGAIMLIYAAGQSSVRGEARLNDMRIELLHKNENLERSLTELQGQVKLLLETQLGIKP